MSTIQVSMDHLNVRATALKTTSESFTKLLLNSIDAQSTLSVIQNAVRTHEEANGNHVRIGEHLRTSSILIMDIGKRFFEIDTSVANTMGVKS